MIPKQNRLETFSWIGVFLVLCAAVIWVRTATVKATYRYVKQEKEIAAINQQIQDHRIEWLKLTSPKRLETIAQKQGLRPAVPSQRVQYGPSRSLN